MAKSAKIKTRKPISTVTLLAWGLLALATAFDHIPSFRAAALILYAVDWLALAIAATLTKRKQTLIIRPGMILPLFISTLLLFQRKIRMTMQPAATIWLVTACFMLLTLPMLLAAEKQVPDERADDEKYWGRAVILALVVLLSAHSWACLSNAAFDQSAGSAQTAYITEKWREKHKFSWDYHLRVAASGGDGIADLPDWGGELQPRVRGGRRHRDGVSRLLGRTVLHMGNPSIPLKKQQESRKSLALLGEMAYNSLACDSHRAE